MGVLDQPINDALAVVAETLSDTKALFRRVEEVYDSGADTTTEVPYEAEVFITPPASYKTHQIDGESILVTDLQTIAPAQPFKDQGFDPEPNDEAKVFVTVGGRVHQVFRVEFIRASNDDVSGYIFQLRS